jgi:hypothetical protein
VAFGTGDGHGVGQISLGALAVNAFATSRSTRVADGHAA